LHSGLGQSRVGQAAAADSMPVRPLAEALREAMMQKREALV